ncbi:MAG TPA: rod-binding protein [Bryobacteraceae bacterium]|nr:rod-binding protein [Bryobacteraceae bacterium]
MADSLLVVPVSSSLPSGDLRPKDVKQAATQFEAMLVAQMFKEMRAASGSGWLGTGEDESSASMMDLADEHLAQVLASQGGLGLARMVVKSVDQQAAASVPGTTPAVPPASSAMPKSGSR